MSEIVEAWETTLINQLKAKPQYWAATSQTIPIEMRDLDQWVVADQSKRPMRGSGSPASVTNPAHWTEFGEALTTVCEGWPACYLGFVFTGDDSLCGIDLDNVRDPGTGVIEEWAQRIVADLNSYTEISISGEGLHIICNAALPEGRGRKFSHERLIDTGFVEPRNQGSGSLEIYDRARYFVTTGIELPGEFRAVETCQKQINKLLEWLDK